MIYVDLKKGINRQQKVEIKGSLGEVMTEAVFLLACIYDKMEEKGMDEEKKNALMQKMFRDAIDFDKKAREGKNDKGTANR